MLATRTGRKLLNQPVRYFAGKQLIFGAKARKQMLEGCTNLA
jgi:hypothetical protein